MKYATLNTKSALSLSVVIGMLINTSTLFRGKLPEGPSCGYIVNKNFFSLVLSRFENCDSNLIQLIAGDPSTLLDKGNVWQSRPGYILLGSLIKFFSGNHSALPFIFLNILILLGTSYTVHKIFFVRTEHVRLSAKQLLPYFSMQILIWVNPVTRGFLWTAHFQMFNLLLPVMAVGLFYLISIKKLRISLLLSFAVGSTLLLYSGGVIFVLIYFASLILKHKHVKFYVATLLPYSSWFLFVYLKNGSFYDHATGTYRQYVWIVDDLRKADPLNSLSSDVVAYFHSFILSFGDIYIMSSIFMVAVGLLGFWLFIVKENSVFKLNQFKLHMKNFQLGFMICFFLLVLSLGTNSFYAPRLNWNLVIILQLYLLVMIFNYSVSDVVSKPSKAKSIVESKPSKDQRPLMLISFSLAFCQLSFFLFTYGPWN
jgi:hypothetical protein